MVIKFTVAFMVFPVLMQERLPIKWLWQILKCDECWYFLAVAAATKGIVPYLVVSVGSLVLASAAVG